MNGPTCSWCGRGVATALHEDDCFCGMCVECGFMHDAGPCRSGVVLFHMYSYDDGFVHAIQWASSNASIVIPACFNSPNHAKPWPVGSMFDFVKAAVDCLHCLGA